MRLFFAVELDPSVRQAVAAQLSRLRPLAPDARWVKPEALHLTLAFLGEVPEAELPSLSALALETARHHAPFQLGAGGGGAFGARQHPRVLWVGLTGALDSLHALQQELAQGLATLGRPLEERPFSPHLTLARARAPRGDARLAACAEVLTHVNCGEGQIGKLILFQSRLSPGGALHTPLVEAPLPGC